VLVEVMVGAVVLAIATLAILNGIDGAESARAKNKARSVQASLAQQDIERMRSMPLSQLDNLRQTRTVNVSTPTRTSSGRRSSPPASWTSRPPTRSSTTSRSPPTVTRARPRSRSTAPA
jgi:Tfp pilus assembly protein PilV